MGPSSPDERPSEPDQAMDLDLALAMPPTDEDALERDDRVYTPPPHIAARFYRPSQARRRDSAASSRRNSISSAHSRCSSIQRSASREPLHHHQSKHVAQHLRRASFLEDRRARLADRAAHAEKVRLRAAVAKAAPRGQSSSEEKALAAQQARERNLAEIVANCAEEVKKAKQVAELTKEKREQELVKMRAKMEERLAEAERRREELRSKSTRPPRAPRKLARESDRPVLTDDEAASRIQSWWRARARRRAIHDFNALGLSVDGIRGTSFDQVVELLARQEVLVVTARLLAICGLREGDAGSVQEMAAVRTFLSAFLILGHPKQVLGNKRTDDDDDDDDKTADPLAAHRLPSTDLDNPQLQDLIRKAGDLLVALEGILPRLTPCNRYTMPPALTRTLPEAYAVFYNAFIAWKSRDSDALVEVMLMQFVELDAIFQTVKDSTDDAAAALYRQSIQDNQLMLVVRIKKLAGPERGKRLIFRAVADARKARSAKKTTADTKPRVAEGESAAASSLVGGAETGAQTPAPARTPIQTPTPPSTPASGSTAAPSREPPVVRTGLNGLLPDNRVVVHELAINKAYQIPWEEYVEQQAVLARPLYAQMRVAAASGSDGEASFRFFMLMSGSIRDKLQRLLKPGNSLYNLIGEMLDPEMAERQFALGNFSYEKLFAAMGSLLPKLCAPFRDEEVADLVQNRLAPGCDVISRVEALNGFIDAMLCDYINYLLRIAAPQLIESAAPYEAKRFAADMTDGSGCDLSTAEEAWRAARAKVVAEAQRRDPEGVTQLARVPAARVYEQMLVDVFTQPAPVEAERVPEMLRLDVGRVNEVSAMARRIITVGAVLLQCKNLLKRDVRTQWKAEANRIMAVLEAGEDGEYDSASMLDGTMAALEAGRCMPAATRSHLRALVAKVLSAGHDMARTKSEPREPVLRLLLTRLRGNLLARLLPGSASDKVKTANAMGERLASLGLSEFVERVRGMADLLDKVGGVDRAAHGAWWDVVAARVVEEES
ncbi:hypothetical protein CDD80_2362 [Ophiocordyceps camponoti-rufipedis]|uniref:IQ calmodulin-binding motif domain protein n=1 Tax=Ophiocordyceps camponoti-rufipedis TaxID=2004952 RepID=A0A2C5Z6P5_9HYPO|nr:hypothetical protein CDD80_2362 [Ophiocordyceps camponoti-rufipedis]